MLNLKVILPMLTDFFHQNDYCWIAYLFGSYQDGTAHAKSDLDLAVLFKKDTDLWQEMAFQAEVSKLLHFEKIDLVNLSKTPLRMQFIIISTGQLIYEADDEVTSGFLERILHQYHDREYRYRAFFKDWDEGLKEDYCNGESR